MSFPYPPKPWSDGDTASQLQTDGTIITGTYNALDNVWKMVRSNPDDTLDDGYISDQQILLAPRVDLEGGVEPVNYTAAFADLNDGQSRGVATQFDVNNESVYALFNQRRKVTRSKTTSSYIQNNVASDDWEYDSTGQPSSLPPQGKFHLFDSNGQPNSHWADVTKVIINGTGRNLNSLAEIRKGMLLEFQDVLINSSAQYVVADVVTIGDPQGGQFWLQLGVIPAYERALGVVPDGAVCEIQLSSPHPCLTSKGFQSAPIVDDDGYLWYDEVSKTLFVSDWDDAQDANGDATWIPVNNTGVFVGEFPPTTTPQQGDEWFNPNTLLLSIYVVTDTQTGDGEWMPTTQQDLILVNAAVDAKFDMLRSAIAESTDFATLKARLMAVLQ